MLVSGVKRLKAVKFPSASANSFGIVVVKQDGIIFFPSKLSLTQPELLLISSMAIGAGDRIGNILFI